MSKGHKVIGTITDEDFEELKGLSLEQDRLRGRVDDLIDRILGRFGIKKEGGNRYYVDLFTKELTVRED